MIAVKKENLDKLLIEYRVQPVGAGYIDCIVLKHLVKDFIDALSKQGISVSALTWWCHVKEDGTGCPHGMGGPKSRYDTGWFSEIPHPIVTFSSNQEAIDFIQNPKDQGVFPCFVPALWLDVTKAWVLDM